MGVLASRLGAGRVGGSGESRGQVGFRIEEGLDKIGGNQREAPEDRRIV